MAQNLDKEADLKMMKSFGARFNWLHGDLNQTVFFDCMCQNHTWVHKTEFP